MHALRAFAVLVLCVSAFPGRADDSEQTRAEEIAVQAWGNTHQDCAEWSDTCVVCRRAPEQNTCSLPGIACMPEATVCRQPLERSKP